MAFDYLLEAFIDEVKQDGMLHVSEDVQGGAFYFPMFPFSDEARKKFPNKQHPVDHVEEVMGFGLQSAIRVFKRMPSDRAQLHVLEIAELVGVLRLHLDRDE